MYWETPESIFVMFFECRALGQVINRTTMVGDGSVYARPNTELYQPQATVQVTNIVE